ncbi:MAG TPA: hypothetical protein VFD38_03080 [Myxococcaceae bacterium]|nr:hypothetical protein [Myxococcaceae bacterium]
MCGAGQAASNTPRTLSGALTYERVPATPSGLDYASISRLPIRGAVVELLAAGATLVTTTSDDAGHFNASWTGPAIVTVRVKAETVQPGIRVENSSANDALYTLESCVDSALTPFTEINGSTGWGGTRYTGPRTAAPFAILDTIYSASRAFLDERQVAFTPVIASWSVRNPPEFTRYDPATRRILLSGIADEDTDEFDVGLITHEWGHHFIHTLSRSDDVHSMNIGGHGFGTIHDPRLTWNEGWATAVAQLVLPGTDFIDTGGRGQRQAIHFDAENDNNGLFDECPGWVSENAVVHVLTDLFDPDSAAEPSDGVHLSPGEVYDLMSGPHRQIEAFTTIFSFLEVVKAAHPAIAQEVDAIATRYGVNGTDAWATGETYDAPGTCVGGGTPASPGLEGILPVYHWLEVDGPPAQLIVTFDVTRFIVNPSRFAAFVGTGSPVTLIADGAGQNVLLEVFENGALKQTGVRQTDGTYLLPGFATSLGKRYTVAVSGPAAGAYIWPVTLRLTN